MAPLRALLATAAGLHGAAAGEASGMTLMNPIRKVVTLLQTMQKKVTEEGEAEAQLYKKFMCYCNTGTGDLTAAVSDANTKTPALQSEIEASEGRLTQSKADLKQAQVDRVSANEAMAEATALREKEATAFAATKSEADTNIAAITKAVAALVKGHSGSFLQTQSAQVLRKLLSDSKIDMTDADRQDVAAFLEQNSQYAPQSGAIIGILKQLGDEMSKDLSDLVATEDAAIKNYEALIAAKKMEVAALSQTVEAKTTQIGELGVAIVQLKEDLTDTEAALVENQKLLREFEKSCSTKTAEWEERQKTRADELVALADTIKVLNDDDALDLFKKTLPGSAASLLQLHSGAAQRSRALATIQAMRRTASVSLRPQLDFLALALSGHRSLQQGGFDQVIKMCDTMVATLKTEQEDDDHKQEYCKTQLDQADDKKKELERTVADEAVAIEDAKSGVATVTEEIAALEAGIRELDGSVAQATEQRKAEHEEYKSLMASDSAAKELLLFAKNRLNKFYNPNNYKAPPKQELTEEERIAVNNGGTPPPTEAPGGIAGTGVTALVQIAEHRQFSADSQAPPPPPATWDAYQNKAEGSNGVISMIDLLIKDLDKELTEAEADEKNAQEEYQTMMSDSAEKRAQDAVSLTQKEGAKAQMETDIQSHGESHKAAVSELMATEGYIHSLHSECDWLMKYYDVRKAARADEIDSLGRAKAVLSGADLSLVQTARGFLSRRQ